MPPVNSIGARANIIDAPANSVGERTVLGLKRYYGMNNEQTIFLLL